MAELDILPPVSLARPRGMDSLTSWGTSMGGRGLVREQFLNSSPWGHLPGQPSLGCPLGNCGGMPGVAVPLSRPSRALGTASRSGVPAPRTPALSPPVSPLWASPQTSSHLTTPLLPVLHSAAPYQKWPCGPVCSQSPQPGYTLLGAHSACPLPSTPSPEQRLHTCVLQSQRTQC